MKTLKQAFWDFVGKHDVRFASSKELPELQRVYSMYSKEVADEIKEKEKELNALRDEGTKLRRAYYKTLFYMKNNDK